ncbi:class I SAM-dependent methyltransferase [Paenibacillus chungangensis]|uniref:Class I SAM-dependent methyltransferase n=1 Tax=Paenibacillus chungangensis TaxID=696535 RepID=A0ABW3HN87_9BACL
MIVTTSVKPSETLLTQARRLSRQLDIPLVARRNATVRKLVGEQTNRRVIVVTEEGVRFYDGNGNQPDTPLFYHPSMALVRVKRLRAGESDPLIAYSGCSRGDAVLDCTAGLCADSLVFAYAAGAEGNVTALESEPVLHAIVSEGLATYESGLPDVDAAMRRISLQCRNHADYLEQQPDNSVDIVYFDPMFRRPVYESSSIGAIRTVANSGALLPEAIGHAKRIARKSVVLKEQYGSEEFERLGFLELPSKKSTKIAYGVIQVGEG